MTVYLSQTEEMIAPMQVIYMRRTGAYGEENHALMRCFKNWLTANDLDGENTVVLAMALDDPYKTDDAQCRYDVCTPYPEEKPLDLTQVQLRDIAGGKYVTFLLPHTAAALQRAWQQCFAQLHTEGYVIDESRPIMERYQKALVMRHRCELCIPVL